MRRPHQQPSQQLVAGLRNAELGLALARGALPGDEPEVSPDGAARGEAMRIVDREDEGQRRQRSHARDLPQGLGLGVDLGAQAHDGAIRLHDLGREISDHGQMRREDRRERRRDRVRQLAGEGGRGAGRQSPALRLHGLAHVVDQRRPRADETVAGADHGQIALGLETAMSHGRQQRGVDPPQPRQVLGVGAVVFRRARRNQAHPARVGHDHLMAQLSRAAD